MQPSATEMTFERTLTPQRPASLEVELDAASVRVSAGPGDTIQVRGILRARRTLLGWGNEEERIQWTAANPPVWQEGNRVRVGDPGRGIVLLLDIVVPPDTRVTARADSGDIRVEDVAAGVACETDSGSIQIGSVQGGVRASSDSGHIAMRGIQGPVFTETDSGGIEAFEIGGAVDARADSGEIRISQTVPAAVRARSDSGAVDVKLAAGAGYNIRVQSDSGSITLPPVTFQRAASPHDIEAQVSGGGPLVDVVTDSGSIDIS